jgi:L-fuconolactonase
MRRVDAHHHLWDPARRAYPWMDERLAPFQRRFGPEDLDAAAGPHGIGQTVVVQTVASVEETKEFLAVAGTGGRVAGVVGWVDLTVADVADAVAALRAAPGGEVLVGIRHQVHDEPDPAWLVRGEVLAGLAAVAEAGLAYDLLVRERELPAARAVAERLPQLGFVLDHLAKPRIREGLVEPWATELRALARLPNVTCKVSGLVTEADWDAWTPEQLVRYVATAADAFGPDRLLFGSDWPVCLLAADYAEVVMAAEQALETAGLDAAERDLVFGANARRVYRLPEPTDDHGG